MNRELHFDYTTFGHVTVDVLSDGTRRPGGSAFYSALQAARLGSRTLIMTRGVAREIEELLDPYLGEVSLRVEPAPATTTFHTEGIGATRRQRLLAWAGPMQPSEQVRSSILHLAPVARELPARVGFSAEFVGLTPQGLVREWTAEDGEVQMIAPADTGTEGEHGDPPARDAPPPHLLGCRCDAIVVHTTELASCAELVAAARSAGAVVAVTAGAEPTTLLPAGGMPIEIAAAPIERPLDDLGAGDVFAAAFFISLHEGASPQPAGNFASAAAAVRMDGVGAGALGNRAQVEARLRRAAQAPR